MTSETPSLQRETPGSTLPGVFGVGAGLALIAACIAVVVLFGWRTAPAAAALGARYDVGELPFGFELHDDAFLLPGGERVFVLRPPEDAAPTEGDAAAVVEEASEVDATEPGQDAIGAGDGAGGDGEDSVDWSTIIGVAMGQPPAELYLVQYPLGPGGAVIDAQFRSLEWKDLSRIDVDGGSTPVEGGRIEWAGYAADFVRVRRFSSNPYLSFRDVLRVNLSVGQECWVAYAVWPPMSEGSTEPVRALLEAVQPRGD